MEKVYIETTVPSYLTAKPTENLIAGARQLITQRWWELERHRFQLFVSDVVLLECSMGDADAAARRLDAIIDFPVLEIDDAAVDLAEAVFSALDIPEKARDDALNIAVACRCEMDYLLSWNFKHIVNAVTLRKLGHFISGTKYRLPQICTPEELIS